jgi:FkbM family methyltransferase
MCFIPARPSARAQAGKYTWKRLNGHLNQFKTERGEIVITELVFDMGMDIGEDTAYYLARGYRVVAVDADPNMIEKAKVRFQDALISKRLILLNYAICDKDDQEVDFHISKTPGKSSLKYTISNREGSHSRTIKMKTKRLSSLMKEYGVPFYCKIDIEGYDTIALETLSDLGVLPRFISVETECLGKNETLSREASLATLRNLYKLGYSGFKLIDQRSLVELKPGIVHFKKRTLIDRLKRVLRKYHVLSPESFKKVIGDEFEYDFPHGSSGPFGDDLEGDWLDYQEAENNLLFHRNSYFSLPSSVNYGFWCDWHAKL